MTKKWRLHLVRKEYGYVEFEGGDTKEEALALYEQGAGDEVIEDYDNRTIDELSWVDPTIDDVEEIK